MKDHGIKTIFTGISICGMLALFSCRNTSSPAEKIDLQKDTEYHRFEPGMLNADSTGIDTLFVQVAYKVDDKRDLIIGKSINDDPKGLRLLLVDKTDQNRLLYISRGAYESWILHPTFFKSDLPGQPLIILAAQGTSDSWGQQVLAMYGDRIEEIGYLDVARKEEADTSFYDDERKLTDIAPFTKIKVEKGRMIIRFETDSVLLYGGWKDSYDVVFPGGDIRYIYEGDSLRLVIRE